MRYGAGQLNDARPSPLRFSDGSTIRSQSPDGHRSFRRGRVASSSEACAFSPRSCGPRTSPSLPGEALAPKVTQAAPKSLREIARELAATGYVNKRGQPHSASGICSMLGAARGAQKVLLPARGSSSITPIYVGLRRYRLLRYTLPRYTLIVADGVGLTTAVKCRQREKFRGGGNHGHRKWVSSTVGNLYGTELRAGQQSTTLKEPSNKWGILD